MSKVEMRSEVSFDVDFSYEGKVAWSMDTPAGQKPSDNNIQDNFDLCRELISDGQYELLPAHTPRDLEVGFELLGEDATPEQVAEQEADMQKARDEGKVPYHYEVCYVRFVEKTDEKNPNRKRATRGRGRTKSKANVIPG